MTIALSLTTLPVFTRHVTGLGQCLRKAEVHAARAGFDPALFLPMRLAPDMYDYARQVEVACDYAVRGIARLQESDLPAWGFGAASIADLHARIERTLAYLAAADTAAIDAAADRPITLGANNETRRFSCGATLIAKFTMPNFLFHATAAYSILRLHGVDVGKLDFFARD